MFRKACSLLPTAFPGEPPEPGRRRIGDDHRIQHDAADRLEAVDERVERRGTGNAGRLAHQEKRLCRSCAF